MKTVNEMCDATKVTKITLHYYDKIGLRVAVRAQNGYRYYDEADERKLMQILLFEEMDFSLSQIKTFLSDTHFSNAKAFCLHKDVLIKKRGRLNKIIDRVQKEIEGENLMSFKEFDYTEIEKAKEEYGAEAKQKWGESEAYKQSEKRTSQYSKADFAKIHAEAGEIFSGFSKLENSNSDDAKRWVEKWQAHITKYYYDCTDEILLGLADMYIHDERFLKNIDQYGQGTAQKMSDAIKAVCK
jgi:DNA-binding transcriptional MerR regulator